MKKIFFRKIYPYDPTFNGKYSRYSGYSLSTLNKKSPSVTDNMKISFSKSLADTIYCSSLKRGIETAKLIAEGKNVKHLSCLKEIKFDLKSLVTEEEFERNGSNLVRQRFIQSFINDTLTESREELKKRMDMVLSLINKLPDEQTYLMISHSFFMKLFEIYLDHKELFEKPEMLKKFFDPLKKTYNFGEGFEVQL